MIILWNKCVEFCTKAVKSGESDPNIRALKFLANKHNLDSKQRAWIALLYSTCYCASTTWFIFNMLPDLSNLKLVALTRFWSEHRDLLIFQSDRKYVKNMHWFVPIIADYRTKIGKNHEKVLEVIQNGRQDELFKMMTLLKYCGRFTAFIYIDCIQALFDVEVLINPKNWNDWATAGEGLCHAIGKEDWAELHHKTGKYDISAKDELDTAFDKLKSEINKQAKVTDSELETALCAFRKLFKQSRYYGYYVDRQQEEFLNSRAFFTGQQKKLLQELWKARAACIDNSLLGELNGWRGIRKERHKIFVESGGKRFE